MIGLAVACIFIGLVLAASFAGYELGYAQAEAAYKPILEEQRDAIDSLLPKGVSILVDDIEPGSREDLFNRADPGCELCEGAGLVASAPCPCTQVDIR